MRIEPRTFWFFSFFSLTLPLSTMDNSRGIIYDRNVLIVLLVNNISFSFKYKTFVITFCETIQLSTNSSFNPLPKLGLLNFL
jgi:hypothetical protein